MAAIISSRDTNMASVTSRENTPYVFKNGKCVIRRCHKFMEKVCH